jgi:asparagine synthase (glutamine-hydrolysing)
MSLFAGIYRLNEHDGPPLDPSSIETIKRVISRANDPVTTFSDARLFLAKVDIGAFPERAFNNGEEQCVATVAGSPLLNPSRDAVNSRSRDLLEICKELNRGNTNILRNCQGTYALCHYRPSDGLLTLATDKVGVRPLYFYPGKDYLYFSTSLRVLEALAAVPKRMDVQGVAESVVFGYPLADRTPYADIKVLFNGECLVCDGGTVRRTCYFRWDEIGPTRFTLNELLDCAYDKFVQAVAYRSIDQVSVASNLSGGLDSRCVVTALHSLGKEVYAVTWAADGYLDAPLAREYAKALGIKQIVRCIPALPSWKDLLKCLKQLEWTGEESAPQGKLVFSGDGGSVGVGYEYVTSEQIGWMRSGQQSRFIEFLLKQHSLPRSFMHEAIYRDLQDALRDNLKTELDSIHSHDGGRDLHIFLMQNDQRRHLYPLYENIDTCRVEYLVPFYDGCFLELLTSAPVDIFMEHSFYHHWLDSFPPVLKSVAWQTYPGHLPCPVKLTVSGRTQWDKKRADLFRGKNQEAFLRCAQALVRTNFPSPFFERLRLCGAILLHGLHVSCYSYAFDACVQFYDTYSKCDRDVVFPNQS